MKYLFLQAVLCLSITLLATTTPAQSLRTFSYQGVAHNNGNPVTGTHALYILLTDQNGDEVYRETQSVDFSQDGVFSVTVGAPNGISPSVDFSSPLFLTISIDRDSNYLTKTTPIVSAPRAIVAGTVADGAISTNKLANGAVTFGKLAATGNAGVLTSDGSTMSWQTLGSSGNGSYPVQGSIVPFADASPRTGYTYLGVGDTLGNKWSTLSPLNLTAFFCSSAVQVGDTIYAIGHSLEDVTHYVKTTQKIALPSGTVTPGVSLPQEIGASAVAVWNRKIYIIGGGTAPSGPYIVPLVFYYNTATGSTGRVNYSGWTGRAYASAVTVGDSIWVLGGKTNASRVTTIDVFNPQSETWRKTSIDLKTAVDGAFYGSDGSHIYMLGGVTNSGVNYTGIQTLDLASGTVTAQTGVFPASAYGASVTYDGKIYMFGGTDSLNHNLNRVLIFDMQTRQLTTGAPFPVGRQIPAAGVRNNQFYIFGGYVVSGTLNDGASYAPPFSIHWFRKD